MAKKVPADVSENEAGQPAPHRIRLKGPWQACWLGPLDAGIPETAGQAGEGSAAQTPEQRVQMPASWRDIFGAVPGRARFTRRFHCPTGLEPDDRVFAVLAGFGGRGQLLVDGAAAGTLDSSTGRTAEIEITRLLTPACRLQVELELPEPPTDDQPGGLWGPVYLEIRPGSGSPQAG